MKQIAFLIFVVSIFCFANCKKEVDLPQERTIEGEWAHLLPVHTDWHYYFNDGLLTQSLPITQVIVTSQVYTYAIRHDTVFIGGNASNAPRVWQVQFHCDSIVEVHDITPGIVVSQVMLLKKQ